MFAMRCWREMILSGNSSILAATAPAKSSSVLTPMTPMDGDRVATHENELNRVAAEFLQQISEVGG